MASGQLGFPPPKLLISDIDGTLIRSDKSLDPATIAAVGRLTAAGVPMTLISARPPSGIAPLARQLGLDGPFGAFNGGTLFHGSGRIIERRHVEPAIAARVIHLLRQAGITCWVFADGVWFASDITNPHTPREIRSAMIEPILAPEFGDLLGRIDKIVGVSDDAALMERLEREAAELAGARATVARSQTYYLDTTATDANKGQGVALLAAAFGIDLADVAVIGDQANDVPMFARAGLSIAMGQGPEAVRAKAMLTTRGADDNGLAHAIDTMLLPQIEAA